jgi:methylated-DNA-protein-cysteine methyltransferase related protein
MEKDFYQMIFQVVRLIPYGRVSSYGAIANYLGSANASRMVGWAMNTSHNETIPVPAHRVVNRNGCLTGKAHFKTPSQMQQLLESEGIEVINDQIKNFKALFWDPELELNIE